MAGRSYTVVADAIAITAADDLVSIAAPADATLVIDKVTVTQETQTSSEALAIQLHRSSDAGTGTSVTAQPMEAGDAAFGGTSLRSITADTTITSVLVREAWNVLAPFVWHPTPEERIVVSPSGFFVVRLEVVPGASMTITTVVAFRELGG